MTGFQYHVVSTGGQLPAKWIEIAKAVHGSVDYFHIREKSASANELLTWTDELLKNGVPSSKIVINDRVDVALSRRLSVHLAYHSLPIKEVKRINRVSLTGVSVHSMEEAKKAEADGADYVVFGHLFETNSKPGMKPRGLDALRELVKACSVPVIAIGGIKPHHVPLIQETGAGGIALLSGVMKAENPLKAIQAYRKEEIF